MPKITSIVFVLPLISIVIGSKYDQKFTADNPDKMERPFRISKVNLLWQKARKRLGGRKLDELFADLKLHDEEEGKLKHLKAEGGDPDGEKDARVRKAFLGIMEKFHLHDAIDVADVLPTQKHENDALYMHRPPQKHDISDFGIAMDKKLMKLWEKANMAGFTDDELTNLKKEFQHHQMKVDEFNQLKNEMESMEGISENSIEQFKYSNRSWKDIQKSKDHLKMKHKDLKTNYQSLEKKMLRDDIGKLSFSEPRVYDLWAMAKNANMSEEELESFKEELQHFEHKIKKHEYMKDQATLVHPKEKKRHEGEFDENSEWGKKAIDYGRKIKKIHTELKVRVEKYAARHSEL